MDISKPPKYLLVWSGLGVSNPEAEELEGEKEIKKSLSMRGGFSEGWEGMGGSSSLPNKDSKAGQQGVN